MEPLLERARAYLAGLEADRQAALALSEEKAEEAKLIKARQEGFEAAMAVLCGGISVEPTGVDPEKRGRRRGRRPIRQLILRELSFSGQPMTAAQIARAIDYNSERTETALVRMEKDSQVVRNEAGRWAIGITDLTQMNGHAVRAGNAKLPASGA
jgi:hypothetical protein